MAFVSKVRIRIGGYKFEHCHSVKIKNTWRETTSVCTIEMPDLKRLIKYDILEGDIVKVELSMTPSPGNRDNFNAEFTGFVSEIKKSIPFTIVCEDYSFVWKRSQAKNYSYRNKTLKDIFKDIFKDSVIIDQSLPDLTIKQVLFRKMTPFQVLQKIKQTYFITAYFLGNKLMVGRAYLMETNLPTVGFDLQRNVVRGGDDLVFLSKESRKIRVRAVSILPDGSKLEVEIGDNGGNLRTFHYSDITSEKKLQELAEIDLEKNKIEGVEGSIKVFGLPFCRHSYLAKIRSEEYPEKNGVYMIEEVGTTFDSKGFKRKIKLGKKMG